jgi:hypothetical protein
VLALHHFSDPEAALSEMRRVAGGAWMPTRGRRCRASHSPIGQSLKTGCAS